MSHRNECPTEWEARSQGARAYENGRSSWGNPYRDGGCEEAESAWRSGYRRAEARMEEARQEEEFYRQQENAAAEAEYAAQMEAEQQAQEAPPEPSAYLMQPLRSLEEVLAARAGRDPGFSQTETGSEKAKPPHTQVAPLREKEGRGK